MPITPDVFARFYAAVNTEWPQYGFGVDDAVTQEKRWRRALEDYEPDSLGYALDEWLAKSKKRPHLSDLLELAQTHAKHKLRPRTAITTHWTLCACGCGGRRWLLVLRDPTTKMVRCYPTTVEGIAAVVPERYARSPEVVKTLETIAGDPMTRVLVACRTTGANPLPADAYRIGLDDGDVPVYDVPHRFVAPFAPSED